jgi:glucose/arabinose dehydrogenase
LEAPVPLEVSTGNVKEMQQRRITMTKLYEQNCANCHFEDGRGAGGNWISVEKFDQKHDKTFFNAIKNGDDSKGMPSFGDSLSDAEIWGLVVHIRELQGRGLRQEFGGPKATNGVYSSKYHRYRVEEVVRQGLRTPWAIDWLPDGRMFVTNRPGTLLLGRGSDMTPVEGLPPVVEIGQGGLMDVAVHPNYRQNGWIYFAINDPKPGNSREAMTRIYRAKLAAGAAPRLVGWETIWQAEERDYSGAGVHFGCHIVFDGKGMIYFAIGERGNQNLAQDVTRANGKVFRLREDGSLPPDNPFASNQSRTAKAVWSLGHRNPQGLVMTQSGELWDTEHGPRGGDEVNLVKKGRNYGWPVATYSIEYSDQARSHPWAAKEGTVEQPAFRWIPSIGASGLDIGKGSAFSKWNGDLLAGGLAGQTLQRFRMKNGVLVEQEELIWNMGRVRDVRVGPDGYVYLALNGPDRIVRLVPVR